MPLKYIKYGREARYSRECDGWWNTCKIAWTGCNGNSISPTIQEVAETFGKGYAADLNNETDYGISGMFNADTINHPPISSDIIFGIYSNHRAKYITGGVFLYQIAVPENMIGMYVRRCWNGNWSEWKSVTLT